MIATRGRRVARWRLAVVVVVVVVGGGSLHLEGELLFAKTKTSFFVLIHICMYTCMYVCVCIYIYIY